MKKPLPHSACLFTLEASEDACSASLYTAARVAIAIAKAGGCGLFAHWKTARGGEMKRLSSSASSSPSTAKPETKRRKVKYETNKHWVTECDHKYAVCVYMVSCEYCGS